MKPDGVMTSEGLNESHSQVNIVDVIGPDLNLDVLAMVVSRDDNCPFRALDGTQQNLTPFPDKLKALMHAWRRSETTTPPAAIELAERWNFAGYMPRRRPQEWIEFLKQINAETTKALDLDLILDIDSLLKHLKVGNRLKRSPKFHVRLTLTSGLSLNLIGHSICRKIRQRIDNAHFLGVSKSEPAIRDDFDHHNWNHGTFVWTKKANAILE